MARFAIDQRHIDALMPSFREAGIEVSDMELAAPRSMQDKLAQFRMMLDGRGYLHYDRDCTPNIDYSMAEENECLFPKPQTWSRLSEAWVQAEWKYRHVMQLTNPFCAYVFGLFLNGEVTIIDDQEIDDCFLLPTHVNEDHIAESESITRNCGRGWSYRLYSTWNYGKFCWNPSIVKEFSQRTLQNIPALNPRSNTQEIEVALEVLRTQHCLTYEFCNFWYDYPFLFPWRYLGKYVPFIGSVFRDSTTCESPLYKGYTLKINGMSRLFLINGIEYMFHGTNNAWLCLAGHAERYEPVVF